jgi:hypothetical protein
MFQGGEREKKEEKGPLTPNQTTIGDTRRTNNTTKGIFGLLERPHALPEGRRRLSHASKCSTSAYPFLFYYLAKYKIILDLTL